MLSRVTPCKQFRARISFCQVKSHVQTACESYDLNLDFNGFKQLHGTNGYSKTCVKWQLAKRPKIGFQDHLSLNAGHVLVHLTFVVVDG